MLFERKEDGRGKVGQRLTDTGPSLDHQMSIFFECSRHRYCHFLLLRAELEIFRLREQAVGGEYRANPLHKIGTKIIFESDHRRQNTNLQNPNPRETSIIKSQ